MNVTAYMSPGHGRERSEDRLLICDTILAKGRCEMSYIGVPEGCFAIFDGVGGIVGGADASSYAAEQMRWYGGSADAESLRAFMCQIGMNLYCGRQNATTATGLYIESGRALLFHVGNTRMYVSSDRFLERITDDQTTLAEGFTEETITRDVRDAYGHEITGCLGGMNEALSRRVSVQDVTGLFSGAKMILFTCDGIHDYIDVDTLEKLAKGALTMEQIVEQARDAGSDDDCSMLLLEIGA